MTAATKKFTMSSLKSWIRKNVATLQILESTRFDGMYDCVMPSKDQSWSDVDVIDLTDKRTLGISGAWFVGDSRDYLYPKTVDDKIVSVFVSNCCGSFEFKV